MHLVLGALLAGRLVVVARGLYLARHLFTLLQYYKGEGGVSRAPTFVLRNLWTAPNSLPFYHPFRLPVADTEALVALYPGTDHGTAHPAPESDQRCPHNPAAPGTGFLAGTAPSSTTSTEAAAVVESLLSHCPSLPTRFFSEDNF